VTCTYKSTGFDWDDGNGSFKLPIRSWIIFSKALARYTDYATTGDGFVNPAALRAGNRGEQHFDFPAAPHENAR